MSFAALLALAIPLTLGACQKGDSNDHTGTEQGEEAHSASSQSSDLIQEYQRRLDSMNDKLASLQGKIEHETAQSKEEISDMTEEQIDKLQAKKDELSDKLDELREVSKDQWVETKERFDEAVGELESEIEKMTN
jgi:uncharacterized protein YPO0396